MPPRSGRRRDNGKPGVRTDYGEAHYAAFVIDPGRLSHGSPLREVTLRASSASQS
jgi:hypothetical protein